MRHPLRMQRSAKPPTTDGPRHGIARVLSKAGLCSRTHAAAWVREGRVAVNDRVVRDPEHPVRPGVDRVAVDGRDIAVAQRLYLALNKPRGLVTTASDEKGRDTVYSWFAEAGLSWLAPVGRLDQASEGLLLMSNDPDWAAAITDSATGPDKTYHVQVDAIPDPALLAQRVRVAIGSVALGELAKSQWRHLAAAEVAAMLPATRLTGAAVRP